MKAVNKLAGLLSLSLFASLAVSAKTSEQLYIETCRKGSEVPVPVAVVTPSVEAGYAGALVELTFVVDPTGEPTALAVKSSPDATLAAAVVGAVKQWRFKPVLRNGVPVATKVTLPVRIVDGALAGASYAMK